MSTDVFVTYLPGRSRMNARFTLDDREVVEHKTNRGLSPAPAVGNFLASRRTQ
jgi:hypothetical protein